MAWILGTSGPGIPNSDGGIKVEASMCYLRGVLMTRLNRQDKAREHFMEALALDVKCFDAFEELVGGQLLAADEGMPLQTHYVRPLRANGICTRMGLRAGPAVQATSA